MRRSHHFLAQCLATPWAMDPTAIESYARILTRAYNQPRLPAAMEDDEVLGSSPKAARGGPAVVGGTNIAVIPVFGAITQRAAELGPCDGGTACEIISSQLRAAMADDSVGQVLLDINSPGGSVFGVMELADEIRAARKPVVGFANAQAASAAYWLLSACSEAWVTPSGEVGSIGVWMAHADMSKALEQEGVGITLISAGEFKVEGNPYGPLGEAALAHYQESVNMHYARFTKAVAKGRKVPVEAVRENMGKGRMLPAEDARAAGMVDAIGTMDDVIRSMSKKARKPGLAKAQRAIAISSL